MATLSLRMCGAQTPFERAAVPPYTGRPLSCRFGLWGVLCRSLTIFHSASHGPGTGRDACCLPDTPCTPTARRGLRCFQVCPGRSSLGSRDIGHNPRLPHVSLMLPVLHVRFSLLTAGKTPLTSMAIAPATCTARSPLAQPFNSGSGLDRVTLASRPQDLSLKLGQRLLVPPSLCNKHCTTPLPCSA